MFGLNFPIKADRIKLKLNKSRNYLFLPMDYENV
jgi:hypothetical protein